MPQPFRIPVTKNYPFSERRVVCERLGELIDELVLGAMPRTGRAGSGGRMILGSWARAHTTYGANYREGWPKLQTITDDAIKAAGRNRSFPCGSERKTKD
jgi:hypothetical protein